MNHVTDLSQTTYGFRWGDVLVERVASIIKPRKLQIIRVYCPNGDCVEIQVSKRKTFVTNLGKGNK